MPHFLPAYTFSGIAGDDCNDANAAIHPEALEPCVQGGTTDYNCDGTVQNDCKENAYSLDTSGCMSFGQNGYAASSTTGCSARAISENADTPWNCNPGYRTSYACGLSWVSNIKAQQTDTAYALTAGNRFDSMVPQLLPALIPESQMKYPPDNNCYTACWPTAATQGYTCSTPNPSDPYKIAHYELDETCSGGGSVPSGCYNYFCGFTNPGTTTAYSCGNGGSINPASFTDGYCRAGSGGKCTSQSSSDQYLHDVNCRTDQGFHCVDLTGGSPPAGVQGRCCTNGQRSTGSRCEDPNPCSCGYDIYADPVNYISHCVGNVAAGQACAKFNPPKYGASVLWDTRPFVVG
jgi:hypothetical protein